MSGLILCVVVFLIYSNSFNAAWQFDDLPNITLNPQIHLEQLDSGSFTRAMYASPYEMRFEGLRLHRPVATLSLALNWFVGRDDIFGYHLVNTLIHITTAFFLYLVISSLLKAPNLPQREEIQIHHISLLAALLWAMHPIQTQAVTYIIQRMASMAALFTIGGIYFYLRFRDRNAGKWRYLNLLSCSFFYVLGIGSKENATLLPVSLALIEIVFYQNLADKKRRQKVLTISLGLCAGILFLGTVLFYFFRGNPIEYMSELYLRRPFSLGERLMTEARVIFKYLSLILWPSVDRLSLIHSVPLSNSLWVPWTTLPSIAGVVVLVCGSLAAIRKFPLLAFGLLFFTLNHAVESTFIPLEIIFEHRNYLPSMFLFLPLAAAIEIGFSYCQNRGRLIASVAMIGVIVLVTGLGIGTYFRNLAWSTPKTLWTDVLRKYPDNPRPYQVLADQFKAEKRFDFALALLSKSLKLQKGLPSESLALSLNNLGNIYVDIGDYKQAKMYFHQAFQAYPRHEIARYNLIFVLIRTGEYQMALHATDELLKLNPNHNKYINVKGFILYKMTDYNAAISHFRRALQLAPGYLNALINMGMALSRSGNFERADWFLRLAQAKAPNDTAIMFSRIDNALNSANDMVVKENVDSLLRILTMEQLLELLRNDEQSGLLPYDLGRVMSPVRKRLSMEF
ncbi:MAG: tetratricopeptide repeat protein [Nitrospinales bacterium]